MKHQKKEEYNKKFTSKKQNNTATKWLISANKRFDTIRAFNELRTLDWDQDVYKLKVGDIVYIYLGMPVQKVRIKCRVEKVNLPVSDTDDRKYITGITEEELKEPFVEFYGNTMRLAILEEFVDSDIFGVKALKEHGILGAIRTPRILKGEALAYFEEIDVKDNILKQIVIVLNSYCSLQHNFVLFCFVLISYSLVG